MNINVKDYMPESRESIFIKRTPMDTKAVAFRYASVEKVLEEWYNDINSAEANKAEIPVELQELYEQACETMLKIRMYERDILLGVNK